MKSCFIRKPGIYAAFFLYVLTLSPHLRAEEKPAPSLPEPLTLEYALQLASEPHPDILLSKSEIEEAEARYLGVESETGINASVVGRATWVEPARAAPDQSHNDSMASFSLKKRIYDFGRSSLKLSAAEMDIKANELLYKDAMSRRQIDIMEKFFGVLLADLEFIRNREEVAVAYFRFQSLEKSKELGKASGLELLEAEAKYRETRRKRAASEARQNITRQLLAEALNRPGKLPAALTEPSLLQIDRKLPEMEGLIKSALSKDPVILSLKEKVEAANKRIKAARFEWGPVLSAEFEASAYEREFGSRDRLRAGLVLEIPFYTGGRRESKIAGYTAELHRIEANLRRREMDIRKAVFEIWQQINVLHYQIEEVNSLIKYRDMSLDQARTIYEQGLRAYLGGALVEYSEARLRLAETRYAIALAWARLDALTGEKVFIGGKNE
jgi:outer membrane protein TolC